MRIELTEAVWLEERSELSLEELIELSGLPGDVLQELVDCGVLVPIAAQASEWRFASGYVATVRTAGRLRADFDLDADALALVVRLIERIRELEEQVRALRAGASR